MPDGAHHIDTTPYTLEEVISQVVALVAAAAIRSGAASDREQVRDTALFLHRSFSRTSIGRAPRPGSTYPDPLPI